MPQLMQQNRKQVDPPCGGAVAERRENVVYRRGGELLVRPWRAIVEPAVASRVVVEGDGPAVELAEQVASQVGDAQRHECIRVKLLTPVKQRAKNEVVPGREREIRGPFRS